MTTQTKTRTYGWRSLAARSRTVLALDDTTVEAKTAPRDLLYIDVRHGERHLVVALDADCNVVGMSYLGEDTAHHFAASMARNFARE